MSIEREQGTGNREQEEEERGEQGTGNREQGTEDNAERGVMSDELESHSSLITHHSSLSAPSTFYYLFALLMTLVSMALQADGVKGEAVIDDHGWLHDPQTRGCGENAWDCFKHPQMLYYYRPLLGISFVFGKRWFHVSPQSGHDESFPFHVENLVQHGIVVLLVFWLLRLLFRRDLPAAIGGALFALHPLHVPVTTFIGGRTDNMALIFLALFAIGLLKIGERDKEEGEKRRGGEEETEEEDALSTPDSSFYPSSFILSLVSLVAVRVCGGDFYQRAMFADGVHGSFAADDASSAYELAQAVVAEFVCGPHRRVSVSGAAGFADGDGA